MAKRKSVLSSKVVFLRIFIPALFLYIFYKSIFIMKRNFAKSFPLFTTTTVLSWNQPIYAIKKKKNNEKKNNNQTKLLTPSSINALAWATTYNVPI